MKLFLLFFAVSTVAILTACASTKVDQKKLYTRQEHNKMTLCIGFSDTARYVASKKLEGTPIAQMKSFYASKENSRMNLATVEKVYGEKFTSVWDYSVSFFNECALNVASVPTSRVKMAAYCMQNSLIADVAYSYKSSGAPRENAYAYFAKFNSKTPDMIVDRVYTSTRSRPEIKLDEWNSCMAVISESNE